jgi:hypothetical protein
VDKRYRVHVTSVGTIGGIQETEDGFGFRIQEIEEGHSMWKPNVFVCEGNVYISTELFNTLAGSTLFVRANAKFGRTNLFNIETHIDQILDHITYSSRNDNERDVRKRNQAIFEWLISLI